MTGTETASATALDDAARALGVLQERCTGAGLRHLADGTAEVDVDDVGAGVLDHASGLRHHARLGAEDLHCEGALVATDAKVAERALVPVAQACAADHLGADQTGTEPPTLTPERLHAHPGHGREHYAARDRDRPDVPRGLDIHGHGTES